MSEERHLVGNGPDFQDKPRAGLGLGFVIVIALIAFVSGGIVTLAVTSLSQRETPPTVAGPAVSAALPTQTTPPAQSIEPGQTEGSLAADPTQDSTTTPAIPFTQNPNIPNPEPWQYDPVADKHFDPGHGHWHRGKPPAEPSVTDPEPWQYDPATDQFWHPGHQHWHQGQPPPPDQRQ